MADLMKLVAGLSKTQGWRKWELAPPAYHLPRETSVLGSVWEQQLLSVSGLHTVECGIPQAEPVLYLDSYSVGFASLENPTTAGLEAWPCRSLIPGNVCLPCPSSLLWQDGHQTAPVQFKHCCEDFTESRGEACRFRHRLYAPRSCHRLVMYVTEE